MPQAGFESAIPATERPQRHTLDRAATGIGAYSNYPPYNVLGQNVPLYNSPRVY